MKQLIVPLFMFLLFFKVLCDPLSSTNQQYELLNLFDVGWSLKASNLPESHVKLSKRSMTPQLEYYLRHGDCDFNENKSFLYETKIRAMPIPWRQRKKTVSIILH